MVSWKILIFAEMASYSKVVTGLTGMNVAKNPTHTLGVLYRSSLGWLVWINKCFILQQKFEGSGENASGLPLQKKY